MNTVAFGFTTHGNIEDVTNTCEDLAII